MTTDIQYVVSIDAGPELAVCTAQRMAKSIEHVAYSGDDETANDRYFTWDETAGLVEVTFRCVESSRADEEDYLHYRYVVERKDTQALIQEFMVTIDGRA